MKMPIFTFDVESDGLYGEAFAVAAVVYDWDGTRIDSFEALCPNDKVRIRDPWVKENVLPHLKTQHCVESRREMRELFWNFYQKWREKCLIMADVMYPVDAGFMMKCVLDDVENRRFAAPFPLVDVSSLMLAAGYDPLCDGVEFTGYSGDAHDPLFDATVSALKVVRLLKERRIQLPE